MQQCGGGGELHGLAVVSAVVVGVGWGSQGEQMLEVAVFVVDEDLPGGGAVVEGGGAGGVGGDGSDSGQGAGVLVEAEQGGELEADRGLGGEHHRPVPSTPLG